MLSSFWARTVLFQNVLAITRAACQTSPGLTKAFACTTILTHCRDKVILTPFQLCRCWALALCPHSPTRVTVPFLPSVGTSPLDIHSRLKLNRSDIIAKHSFSIWMKQPKLGLGRNREGTEPPSEVQGRMQLVSVPCAGARSAEATGLSSPRTRAFPWRRMCANKHMPARHFWKLLRDFSSTRLGTQCPFLSFFFLPFFLLQTLGNN